MKEIYTKTIENGYILQIGSSTVSDNLVIEDGITKAEYDEILSVIENKPEDTNTHYYKLKDTLEWEEVPYPEPIEEYATEEDYLAALDRLGVEADA